MLHSIERNEKSYPYSLFNFSSFTAIVPSFSCLPTMKEDLQYKFLMIKNGVWQMSAIYCAYLFHLTKDAGTVGCIIYLLLYPPCVARLQIRRRRNHINVMGTTSQAY